MSLNLLVHPVSSFLTACPCLSSSEHLLLIFQPLLLSRESQTGLDWRDLKDLTGHMRRIFHNKNNLHREAVNSPVLETFKIQLDRMLGHFVYTLFLSRKVGPDDP